MNKIYIILLLLLSHSMVAQERNFKRFRVGISQNYISALIEEKSSIPVLSNTSNAVSIVCLDPAFRINDQWLVGLRYEAYLRKGVVKNTGGNLGYINMTWYGVADPYDGASLCLFAQYYFFKPNARKTKPFVGMGIGRFGQSATYLNLYDRDLATGRYEVDQKFTNGFYPFVGIERGHFFLRFDYNFVMPSNSKLIGTSNGFVPPTSNPRVSNTYYNFKLGFFIGGGKKKKINLNP